MQLIRNVAKTRRSTEIVPAMKITSGYLQNIIWVNNFSAYLGPIRFMTHSAHSAHHNAKSIFVPILQLIYSWDTNFACNNTFTQSDYSSLSSLNSCTALNSYGKIDIPSRDGLQAKVLGTRLAGFKMTMDNFVTAFRIHSTACTACTACV